MARTNWQDHRPQKPRTYTMTDNGDGTVTLIPAQGTIYQQGTPLNAANLNNIEDRIDMMMDSCLELLWQNETPDVNFAAQTVSLSREVGDDEVCLIVYGDLLAATISTIGCVAVCLGGHMAQLETRDAGTSGNNGLRDATISGDTCEFSAATVNGNTSNGNCKPWYILAFSPNWLIMPEYP